MKVVFVSIILVFFAVFSVNASVCCCAGTNMNPPPSSCCPAPSPDDSKNTCDCDGPCAYTANETSCDAAVVKPAPAPVAAAPQQENMASTASAQPARLAVPPSAPPPDALQSRLARLQVWQN